MNKLGEILINRGAVSTDGLRSALEACRRNGGRLGTWLVRLGLVSEAKLLDALAEQTGCPAASTLDVTTAPGDVRSLIPTATARRHMAVAFGRRGRTLDVAMVNPNDLLLVDELASVTRMVIRPHVATEAALGAALALPSGTNDAAAPAPGPARSEVREWRQFWRFESPAADVFRALGAPPLAVPPLAVATFPALAALSDGPVHLPRASNAEELAEALAASTRRDQVAEVALDYLTTLAPRAALFSLHQNKVMAWAARGAGVVAEDFQTLILPLDRPSLFLNLAKGVELHVGPLAGGEGNHLLVDALGAPPPGEAIIVPLRLRAKVAGFLWADNGDDAVADLPLPAIREVADLVSLALEALVIRQKIRAVPRLTEGAVTD